jgi:hypothetical protein
MTDIQTTVGSNTHQTGSQLCTAASRWGSLGMRSFRGSVSWTQQVIINKLTRLQLAYIQDRRHCALPGCTASGCDRERYHHEHIHHYFCFERVPMGPKVSHCLASIGFKP